MRSEEQWACSEVYQVIGRTASQEEHHLAATGPSVFKPILGASAHQRLIFGQQLDYSRVLYLKVDDEIAAHLQFFMAGKGPHRPSWQAVRRDYGPMASALRLVAALALLKWFSRQGAYAYRFIVKEPFRGQRFGAELLEAWCQLMKEQGADKVCLDIWGSNSRAQAFYERQGFRVVRCLALPKILSRWLPDTQVVRLCRQL